MSATTGAVATALGLNALTKVPTHLVSPPDAASLAPQLCEHAQMAVCLWRGGGASRVVLPLSVLSSGDFCAS